ncbi:myogenesis-regulating glycosidase-like [Pecten maximus]|uniref:myogenesis-regulating glycosidase-like n=1 Tax=Pecten maximus TaxID=6579 RepID=UPI0014588ABD|nr:myogenesis-regulating glycosidase-like [Pecten maximus]XP_033763469.1 myogenesis-regulating glycosidase-like [Pecten maximus]
MEGRIVCLLFIVPLVASSEQLAEPDTNGEEEFCSRETCGPMKVTMNQNNDVVISDASWSVHIATAEVLGEALDCTSAGGLDDFRLCRYWPRYGQVEVQHVTGPGELVCHRVTWLPVSLDFVPVDCIDMTDAHWYGGAEHHNQRWPINNVEIPMQPFVSEDLYIRHKSFGNVLEPFWFNSQGLGIMVNDDSPLHVSVNEGQSGKICFKSNISQSFPGKTRNHLEYTICKGKTILDIVQSMSEMAFERPLGIPDIRMITRPIWSTWARYKTLINQSKVLDYAGEIKEFGFKNSQLEIDDMYTTSYGDLDFDPVKFPDPSGMIHTLKDMGYRVTSWVHPFANLESDAFLEGVERGYWLLDSSGQVPALVKWWQGVAAILDTTNPEAAEWFVQRLKIMQEEYGIDSFKFDAGEMTYLPSSYKTFKSLKNPGYYIKSFVDIVTKFGDMIEVRCGYKSQNHQVFVRMADKDSKWGYNNGLKALIPTTLTLGILGYPYILPDMIGGNGYGEVMGVDAVLPERELYIRWLQLTAYLPAMQFSFVPWDYDDEVVEIALLFTKIHEKVVTPILLKAAEASQVSGTPLIRPLWWIAPDDQTAFTIDSEFLVGDSLLVAPILEDGQRQRNIYLPKGTWMDVLAGKIVQGGKWLTDYKIDLKEIATFAKIE